MRKFFAIGGHCTSESRINHATRLILALRTAWPDSFISFCSHITVPERLQHLCDLVLIDKNNLMGNVDFSNAHTEQYRHTFWQIPRPGFNLVKTIPYHQYANHRQYHDLAINLIEIYNAEAITFFTYDCEPSVVKEISMHYDLIEKYDAVFYDFFVEGKSVNTEFFTLSKKTINQAIRKIFKLDDFFSFNKIHEFTLEQIYYALMKREKLKMRILDVREENDGRFGVVAQHEKQDDQHDIRIAPLNCQHPDVQVCPFLDWEEGKTKMVVFMYHHHLPQIPYPISMTFTNRHGDVSDYKFNETINHSCWVLFDIAPGFPIVDVFKRDEHLFRFDLGDLRNYGKMLRAEES